MKNKFIKFLFSLMIFSQFSFAEDLKIEDRAYWLKTPTSIEEIPCGQLLVGAKFNTDSQGQDFLVFYPQTDREFEIPIMHVPAEMSFRLQDVTGFFEIDYPTVNGKKQGYFHFKNFSTTAAVQAIYKNSLKIISDECFNIEL